MAWKHDLSGYPEGVREVVRLHYVSNLECLFTDPRAWAALWWMTSWEAGRRQDRRATRDGLGPSTPAPPPNGQHGYERRRKDRERERTLEKDPDVKLYLGLLAQARALIAKRVGELERRYGRSPFPELESRVAAILGSDLSPMSLVEKMVRARGMLEGPTCRVGVPWLLCAEMEKIVLGDVSAYTAGMVADCEQRRKEQITQAELLLAVGRERLRQAGVWQKLERQSVQPPAAVTSPPPGPASLQSHTTPIENSIRGGALASNRRPAPPPQNEAPAVPAPAAFAPPQRHSRRPKTLQQCRRLIAENERRRLS